MRSVLLIFLLLAGRMAPQAQPTPVMEANAERILIGATVQLQLELRGLPRTATVQWLLPDSFPHFEYLRIDSSLALRRIIEITSWDSGAWMVDGIQAVVQNTPQSQTQKLQFPARLIRVDYDTSSPQVLNTIKPIMEAEDAQANNLLLALLAAGLASLVLLLWFLRNKKKAPLPVFVQSGTALDAFLQTVDRLQQQPAATVADRKALLTELSHALYLYFEQRTGVRLRQHTTDACIRHLHELFPLQQHTELLQLLRLTDAVKFARYDAGVEGCHTALQTARMLIQQMDQQPNP